MILVNYIFWHYTIAPIGILRLLKNYITATWHIFYIKNHLKTFFATWHQMQAKEMFPANNFGDKVGNFIVDIFVRMLAALIRGTIIALGLVSQVLVFIAFIIFLLLWLLWPAVLVFSFVTGVYLMF